MILRACTFLGYVTLAVNRFTAIHYPLNYCNMWSKQRSAKICVFNWVFSMFCILPVSLIGNAKAYYYLSPLQTYEIAFTSGTGMLSLFTNIAILFFTTMICLLFYVLTGFTLLKAKLSKRNVAHVGSAELRYLVYALVTFIPLLLELVRSIVESYPAVADLHGRNELANQLW
ncbi:unnamed protein product [Cylicocyclus nassatus]|uniref:G-protein coupled receptors family 1 profile domain-containing protein n=1 Tax=Cylicocyclus nassatus TaxID=53992 RepID=A0AA36H5F8_CYLNA|nr:unnamed protein product [Cylicocyclus nassatus]